MIFWIDESLAILVSLLVLFGSTKTSAAGTLISDPSSTNGVLKICPDGPLSITCSHSRTANGVTRWVVTRKNTQVCDQLVNHGTPRNENCGPFTITMVSDDTGFQLNSTAQLAAVSETLDGAMVECLDGASSDAESVGNIIIQVVDPTPLVNLVEYFVDSKHSGRATLNVSSPGAYDTNVTYSMTTTNGGGMVQVDDGVITATNLSYNESFIINITSVSSFCTGVQRSILVNGILNARALIFSSLTPSLTCSNSTLDITIVWTIAQGFQQTMNSAVPLSPPLIDVPVFNYKSESGVTGNVTTYSPYILHNPVKNDTYTLYVSAKNSVGAATRNSSVKVTVLGVDASTVATMSCLTVNVSEDCKENISTFSVYFEQGFGNCLTPALIEFFFTSIPLTSHSTCLPVNKSLAIGFCYRITLVCQGTPIATETNINASTCLIKNLELFLEAGVTYVLDSSVNNGTVVHLTRARLSCNSSEQIWERKIETRCIEGQWSSFVMPRSCTSSASPFFKELLYFIVVVLVVVVLPCIHKRFRAKCLKCFKMPGVKQHTCTDDGTIGPVRNFPRKN